MHMTVKTIIPFSCHFLLLQLHLQFREFKAFLTQALVFDINVCCLANQFIDQDKLWDRVMEGVQVLFLRSPLAHNL